MDKTIATKNQIRSGQFVSSKVGADESSVAVLICLSVTFDERRDNVNTDVIHRVEIHVAHPIEIATGGIEQRRNAQFLQQ